MSYKTFRQYVLQPATTGSSHGSIAIITRWLTGNTILVAPEAIITFGLFGGIGYALMGTLALIFFAQIAKKVKENNPQGQSIHDYLQSKLTHFGNQIMMFIMLVTGLGILFMQEVAGGMLVGAIFDIPFSVGQIFITCVYILMTGIRYFSEMTKFTLVQVFFTFLVAILLPLYFFVREGVEHIYQGIRLYHPYLMVMHNVDVLYFIIAGILIFFGKSLIDSEFWKQIFCIEIKKVKPTFILSAVVWGTLPLAFSSLVLIVIFSGGFQNMNTILYELLHRIDSPLLLSLFVICLVSACAFTFVNETKALFALWKLKTKRRQKTGYFFYLLFILFSFIPFLYFQPSLLQILLFFGIIYTSVVFPMMVIIFSKAKVSNIVPLIALISMGIGFASVPVAGPLMRVFISASTSIVLITIFIASKLILNKGISRI